MDNLNIKTPRQLKKKYIKIPYRPKVSKDTTENVVLENNSIKVVIDYNNGGKICSFVSKYTGTEFFYKDPRELFYPEKGYSYHDISGFDECFPTIAPCKYATNGQKISLDDHGLLWQRPWRVESKDKDKLNMYLHLPELGCKFQRECKLEKSSLRLDYTITNYGEFSVPYVYSAHPLLNISENSRLELPKEVKKIYIYASSENSGLKNNTWVDVGILENFKVDFLRSAFSRDRHRFMKFFTDKLTKNETTVYYSDDKQSLKVEFDNTNLPYLGVFISEGFDSLDDGNFERELILGVEPTTGIGDELLTCESTSTVKRLESGEEFNFWMTISYDGKKNI